MRCEPDFEHVLAPKVVPKAFWSEGERARGSPKGVPGHSLDPLADLFDHPPRYHPERPLRVIPWAVRCDPDFQQVLAPKVAPKASGSEG